MAARGSGEATRPATLLLRLYPASWRERYGDEVVALLAERGLTVADRLDLIRGAVDARLHPAAPSALPWIAAILGGALWIAAGLAVALQPVPPDWPGYLIEMIPIALGGTVLVGVAAIGAWLRAGDAHPRHSHVAVTLLIAGFGLWVAGLAATALGIEYGASTAIAQTAAAAGILGVGLLLARTGDWPTAGLVLVSALALVIAHPLSWVAFGLAWIGVGLTRIAEVRRNTDARAGAPA
jgi:hypothetical protein